MTARRQNYHIYTSDGTPIVDPDYQDLIDGIRDLVDSAAGSREKEELLNKSLRTQMGGGWDDNGVYLRYDDAVQIAYGQYIGGDCYLKSLEVFWRLKGVGATRMCGVRAAILNADTPEHPHFWVENKGKVFDWGGGQQKIYNKDRFYADMRIQGAREGNKNGFFRRDSSEITLEKKTIYMLETYGLKKLIDFIKKCCWENNRDSVLELRMRGEI